MRSKLFILSGVVILSLSFFALNKITEMKRMIKVLSSFNVKLQHRVDFLNTNFELNNKIDGKTNPDIICKTLGKEEHYLYELVSESPILICRYFNNFCTSCSDNVFSELIDISILFENLSQSIVIFAPNYLMRELSIFTRSNEIGFSVYYIDNETFSWNNEGKNSPYCFVLHPDMRITNVLVLDKSFPEFNKQYLEGVKRLLSE